MGGFRIVLEKGVLTPIMTLKKNESPFEMLITINHEIVHFLDIHQHLGSISKNDKIKGCLTEFKLAQLQDESVAFLEEIEFWNKEPPWFKDHFKNIKFHSRLLDGQFSYQQYYKILMQKLAADKNLVIKRYIELKEYAPCVLTLI